MKVLSVGEVLWDVIGGVEHLGGAPLNFAAHAVRMGQRAYLLSAVGNDDLGARALAAMDERGVDAKYVSTTAQAGTGTAIVESGELGDAQFVIARPAAYDFLEVTADLLADGFDSIYFGTLLQTFEPARRALRRVLGAFPNARRLYDVNLREGHYTLEIVRESFVLATLVKLNEAEAIELGAGEDLRAWCDAQARLFGWEAVAITRGAAGCAVWLGGEFCEEPGVPVDVVDTVGAGDAFAAAFLHGVSEGWPAQRVAAFGNKVGAAVAGAQGALPE